MVNLRSQICDLRSEIPFLLRRRVLLRIFFYFLDAFITANSDFLATNHDLDTTIVDRPITHGTFFGLHQLLSLN